jgi:hypothetical protein
MAKCYICGQEITFIKRSGKKPLIVNKNPVYFVPDSSGDRYFIHDGVMRRGRATADGLRGYTLHGCEE